MCNQQKSHLIVLCGNLSCNPMTTLKFEIRVSMICSHIKAQLHVFYLFSTAFIHAITVLSTLFCSCIMLLKWIRTMVHSLLSILMMIVAEVHHAALASHLYLVLLISNKTINDMLLFLELGKYCGFL